MKYPISTNTKSNLDSELKASTGLTMLGSPIL